MLRLRFLVRIATLALLTPLALAACAGSATPVLIGSYPKVLSTAVVPSDPYVVYTNEIGLEVGSVAVAARSAADIALNLGGYVVESSQGSLGGRREARFVLAVPVEFYSEVRRSLLGLGRPISERVTGEITVGYNEASRWNTYARLELNLSEPAPLLPRVSWPPIGLSPVETLGQALLVSALLFTSLVNLVIWVVVVLGPFALLALGARWLARQVRKQGP